MPNNRLPMAGWKILDITTGRELAVVFAKTKIGAMRIFARDYGWNEWARAYRMEGGK